MAGIDWAKYKEKSSPIDWSEFKENKNPAETWSSLYKGLIEAYPNALKYGANALAQPFGGHPFQEQEESPTKNWPESVGRGLGKVGGALTLGAPFAIAGNALLPGLAGVSLGSGLGGALTTQGGLKDRAFSGTLSAAIPGTMKGLGALFRLGKSSISSVKPRMTADIIQKSHDLAHAEAVAPLESAARDAASRNIPEPKFDNKIFNIAKEGLGNDVAVRDLISRAKKGEYQAIRDLQSDMGREARILENPNNSRADRLFGKKLESARDLINKTQAAHYEKHGAMDLAENIREGMKRYAEFKKLYYKDPRIAKLVGAERKVPKNINNLIREDSTYMKNFVQHHPKLNKIIKTQEDKELLKKVGKHIGYKAGAAAAIKELMPDIFNDDES